MREVVLDASVGAAWCFEDENDPYAASVLMLGSDMQYTVPQHWSLEVANALATAQRRNRIDDTATHRYAAFLNALPIFVDQETFHHGLRMTLDLAKRHELTTYDAAYLELALRRALPLASQDRKLAAAAIRSGATLFEP